MKKIIFMALMAAAILPTHAENTVTGDNIDNITKSEKNDTVRIHYIMPVSSRVTLRRLSSTSMTR